MSGEKTERRKRQRAGWLAVALAVSLMIALPLTCCTRAGNSPIAKSPEPSASASSDASETATAETPETVLDGRVREKLSTMSLEEKAAQLFIVRPEALTGYDALTQADAALAGGMAARPVGGIVLFQQNLLGPEQAKELLAALQQNAFETVGLPLFTCVDEEGGTVARVGRNEGFDVADVGNMADVGATGDPRNAEDAAIAIGTYLVELGFNVNFAPDADIADNPESDTMLYRSFGSDPRIVSSMVQAQIEGFSNTGILCTAKHFPGIGGAVGDSHNGSIFSDKAQDDMEDAELAPFKAAIESGVPFIMVGHISVPEIAHDNSPASLSPAVVTGLLRNHLGYENIIVTDSLGMGAVNEAYSPDEAAVLALEAGCDMLLMPADFETAYQGVLSAVSEGRLTEERIDESVRRILSTKLQLPIMEQQ